MIDVPTKALAEVPGEPQFRFLGRPGEQIYQLPQAVLGKHVHGEIDPHLWQNVRNAMAYVELIRDTLIDADPAGARDYRANADAYLARLDAARPLRARARSRAIPRSAPLPDHDPRRLRAISRDAYDLEIAGFVTPNPAAEPSLADRRKLTETIRNLDGPGGLPRAQPARPLLHPDRGRRRRRRARLPDLRRHVRRRGRPTYVEMMRFNADSLRRCLA